VSTLTGYHRRFFDPRLCGQERRSANILACLLLWSVLSYLLISRLVFSVTEVAGESMEPTLLNGDRSIVNRWVYRLRPPQRGEVVAVRLPGDETPSVKRIVACPFERIQFRNGVVLVNGRKLSEPYLSPGQYTASGGLAGGVYLVDEDCYFVLGDNRNYSTDSRYVGAVRRYCILGRITVLGSTEKGSLLPF